MKKIFKVLSIVLIICITGTIFIYRNKISFLYNVARECISLKDVKLKIPTDTSKIYLATEKNLVYKSGMNGNLMLDMYSPKESRKKGSPVLVYVHGGSFAYGNKDLPQFLAPALELLRNQGYYIISIDYTLLKDKLNFDTQISDVKDCIRWINKNKVKYNFNTDEIGIFGASAGAYLAMMSSYTNDASYPGDPELEGYSSKIKYLIDYAGPTDLLSLNAKEAAPELNHLKGTIVHKRAFASKLNPINYVNKNTVKTLIIHSKADTLVPYKNSLNLYNKFKECNGNVKMVTLYTNEHDFSNISSSEINLVAQEIFLFILVNSPR